MSKENDTVTIEDMDCDEYQITQRKYLDKLSPEVLQEGEDVIVTSVDDQAKFLKFLVEQGIVE